MPSSGARELTPDLAVRGLALSYGTRGREAAVLDLPTLSLEGGARLGVTGPSGSGKTSLLHLLAGIERPTSGSIRWGAMALDESRENERGRWRRETVGLVFQAFHLVPNLSALQNVLLPYRFAHWGVPAALRASAREALRDVGVRDPDLRAGALSRGEQQRVAVTRALLHGPRILLADEPTASLDAENAHAIGDLLVASAARLGATLVVVSHDAALLAKLPRVLRLEAGRALAGALS